MVWFGQNSEAEFNTVSESVSESVTKVGIELLGQLKNHGFIMQALVLVKHSLGEVSKGYCQNSSG